MNILAVETALGACSAAVLSAGRVAANEHRPMLRGHAENLAPMVERVMRAAGMDFKSLQRIAVTTGPGTFTGQRVGLAFARALGVALRIPVAGVTTLEAMAEEALSADPAATWAIAAADARRDEMYLSATAADGSLLLSSRLIPVSGIVPVVAQTGSIFGVSPLIAGTAADIVFDALASTGFRPCKTRVHQPNAVFVAIRAARDPGPEPARALYLRAPDAKLPRQSP